MPWLVSVSVRTMFGSTAAEKLGHPVPESNLVDLSNNSAPQHAQRYVPASWLSQYLPVNAGSVPFCRATWYCSGLNSLRHSSSVFFTFSIALLAYPIALTLKFATPFRAHLPARSPPTVPPLVPRRRTRRHPRAQRHDASHLHARRTPIGPHGPAKRS